MDDQRQQRMNEAAEQFTNAVTESYRVVSERGSSAQELNAELTQQFFSAVIETLRRQAEETRGASQELAEQTERSQEAAQALAQESIEVYRDFLNSMVSFAQESTQAAERGATEAQRTATTEAPPERQVVGTELPLEDYDSLTVEQISERLDGLGAEELRQLRTYEAENKGRSTLLQRLDERIEAGGSAS